MSESEGRKEVYEDWKRIIGRIFLDNQDEMSENMKDREGCEIKCMVRGVISGWGQDQNIQLKGYK